MTAIGYPLLLEPRHDEKIWGGRRLETVLGKALPPEVAVGESLETGDEAIVTNGALAGRSLGDLARELPGALLGSRGALASAPFGDFPLLVKFIDASDALSLQVHPDDAAAAPLSKRGKTEAWHVIEAEPGAALITGLRGEVTVDEVRQAIEQSRFEGLIERRPVQRGETLIVPAGTVHAIDAGVLLYEIQETSDITYRLYDWGRVDHLGRPRDLHVEDALRVMVPGRRAITTTPLALDELRTVLAACRYFTLERWEIVDGWAVPAPGGASFRLLSCVSGEAELRFGDSTLRLARGQTALLPADLPACTLDGQAAILCGWIADLAAEIVGPLLDAGHGPEPIALLGGGTGDMQGALATAQRLRAAGPARRGTPDPA